jgi:hypothetical protein
LRIREYALRQEQHFNDAVSRLSAQGVLGELLSDIGAVTEQFGSSLSASKYAKHGIGVEIAGKVMGGLGDAIRNTGILDYSYSEAVALRDSHLNQLGLADFHLRLRKENFPYVGSNEAQRKLAVYFDGNPRNDDQINLYGGRTLSEQNALISSAPIFATPECFPSGTPIQLSDGTTKPIENISTSDVVAAFDGGEDGGGGALAAKPVTRLFTNITDTWIVLSNGLTVTPGHHFLDAHGEFRTIADILADDGRIVREDGTVATVTGETIRYSKDTADLYEQAEGYVAQTDGGLALAPAANDNAKTAQWRAA